MTTVNPDTRLADMDWLRGLAIDARSPELVSAIESLKRKYTSRAPMVPLVSGEIDLTARLAIDLANAFKLKATQLGADVSSENLADFQGYAQGTISDALARTRAIGPRSNADVHIYCKGLEAAAKLCERPAKALDSDVIESAAPVHAQVLRGLIQAYTRSDETSAEQPSWPELADYLDRLEDQMKAVDADMMVDEETPPSVWADRIRKFAATRPDDLSSDERWQAGCDHAVEQVCNYLRVEAPAHAPGTELRQIIHGIMQAKLGERWWPDSEWIHVRPHQKQCLELIREAGYTFRGIEYLEATRRSLVDAVGDLYQKNERLESSARVSQIAPILEALRAIRDLSTVELGSSDAFRARMVEIRRRADSALQVQPPPGSIAAETLELAQEFEGEARAHEAMKDHAEAKKCLRAAYALRKLADISPQAKLPPAAANSTPSGDPAGRQYRYMQDGGWSDWISMPNTMEPLQQDNLQYRFVYAGPEATADTFKHMWEQVQEARAAGTFSSATTAPVALTSAVNPGGTAPHDLVERDVPNTSSWDRERLARDLGRLLKILKLAYSKGGARLVSVWQVDIDAIESVLKALPGPATPKLSANAKALIDVWLTTVSQPRGRHEVVGMKIDKLKLNFLDTVSAFEEIVMVASGHGTETEPEAVPIAPTSELQLLSSWIREPDASENFSLDKVVSWINSRPIAELDRIVAVASAAMGEEIVWLRQMDAGTDNACWVVCNQADPDATPFSKHETITA
jgi:hypothetical protein